MSTPDPVQSKGWQPTTSTMAGAVLGGALAQLITAGFESVTHSILSAPTAGALSTVCVFAVGYLFPDGGRK